MVSDTRNRILSVAARLFESDGFEGTAVASILREADVNSGSLYHFFPSKEALLVAVLEKYQATLEPALLRAADRATDDPVEKIFALIELYRGRLLVSGLSRGCPVGDLSLEIGGRLPEARRLVDSYFETWTGQVEEWLEAAGSRLPPKVKRHALAVHALSVMQGGIMQARAGSSIVPFDESVSHFRLLLDLLGAEADTAAGGRTTKRRLRAAGTPVLKREPASGTAAAAGTTPLAADPAGEALDLEEAAWWKAW